MKKVVIVGAGFAGVQVAKKLANNSAFQVELIDRRNHHLFQPLLYQVAMAGLSSTDIAIPIRTLFSGVKNISVFLGEVTHLNLSENTVESERGEFHYDYLVLACGARHSYFGHDQWATFAPALKTLEHALDIRARVLRAFESAESESDAEKRKELMTFVVIGGGPTGVELAGAIGELSHFTLAKDFRRIQPSTARIILIEAGDRILNSFDPLLSQKATRALENLGVQVCTHSKVTQISEVGVQVGSESLKASTVLWAAGVQPSSLNQQLNSPKDRIGRVEIQRNLSLKEHPNVFVLGDQSTLIDENGQALPGIAPVAIQQGNFLASLLKDELKGMTRKEFKYKDKGQMATIGRKMAVLQIGKLKLWGFSAWCIWLFVHIYYLNGFKNRLFVFAQWTWNYMSYAKGARIILNHKK
jgi:NADH dehydrogenase